LKPILRPATPADGDAVATVLLASRREFLPYLPSPRTEAEIRAWMRDVVIPREHVVVAELDGRIVGYVASHGTASESWISHLYLAPGFTRNGIGSALLAHALEFATRPVRLWAFQQNTAARLFYERHGFQPVRFTDGRDNEEHMPDALYELAESRSDRVVLHEYSPEWPALFDMEERLLRDAFSGVDVAIEHVGSTSVPGMAAKPVVDILLGAESLAVIEQRIEALRTAGYRYVPEFERLLPQRRYFVKPDRRNARVHLHAVQREGPFWREQVAFRERLRTDPALFSGYLELKRHLATQFPSDRNAYTDAKAPFIRATLAADSGMVERKP
jgi:GrpB-like predicted nucleotidyltransferase (UPF0157 family)/ribosomal protein S18 acetylase RimI-like enzyme